VFWEFNDIPLELVERIEIVRGPGASLWGANAVNGVINIITRNAASAQGTQVSAAAGTELHGPVHSHGWCRTPRTSRRRSQYVEPRPPPRMAARATSGAPAAGFRLDGAAPTPSACKAACAQRGGRPP
jgi:iron complex outermembrane receptor protein